MENKEKNMVLSQVNGLNFDKLSYLFPKEMKEVLEHTGVYAYAAVEQSAAGAVPLGSCVLCMEEESEEKSCALLWLYVPREYRLQGVGNFLLTQVTDMLAAYDASDLYVSYEAVEQIKGLTEYLYKHGFTLNHENDILEYRFKEQSVIKKSVDEALMKLNPKMPEMLPRFFRLENILEESGFAYTADADEIYGPHFIISFEDGIDVRLYTLSDPENTEQFVICVSSELQFAHMDEKAMDAKLTAWEEEAEIAQAEVSVATDVVSTNAFFTFDEDEDIQMFRDFLEAFHKETSMLKNMR